MFNHSHANEHQVKNKNILKFAFLLTIFFAILEIVSGKLVHSLALFSEGVHMFSDGLSLGLGFVAAFLTMKMAPKNKTFGYSRIETIAAFLNGLALLAIPIYVFIQALGRFFHPQQVLGLNMLVVAVIGLVINGLVAFMLSKGDHEHNLNMRAAALHVIADLISSVSTIIASLLIIKFGWVIVDPIISIIVSAIIFKGGLSITKESFHILMEGAPEGVCPDNLKEELEKLHGVKDVHDIHVWTVSSGFHSLTCHIVVENEHLKEEILKQSMAKIRELFEIEHVSIQLEKMDYASM